MFEDIVVISSLVAQLNDAPVFTLLKPESIYTGGKL